MSIHRHGHERGALSLHDQTRVAEVLCAIKRIIETTGHLPDAHEISAATGYPADEMLVFLSVKGWTKAHGPVGANWFSLTERGESHIAHYCRS